MTLFPGSQSCSVLSSSLSNWSLTQPQGGEELVRLGRSRREAGSQGIGHCNTSQPQLEQYRIVPHTGKVHDYTYRSQSSSVLNSTLVLVLDPQLDLELTLTLTTAPEPVLTLTQTLF